MDEYEDLPEMPELDIAVLEDAIIKFEMTGDFGLALGEPNLDNVRIGWMDVAIEYVTKLDLENQQAIEESVEMLLSALREYGVDTADPAQVHALVWGCYITYASQISLLTAEVWHPDDADHKRDVGGHISRGSIVAAKVAERLLNGVTV